MPILPLPGPSAVLMYRKSLHPESQPLADKIGVDDAASVTHESTIHHLQIIAKGHGYMAVSVTVDEVEYTGMLFTHNTSNGLSGLFAEAERKKFEDLCRNDAPADAFGIDQWTASLVDRQLMPGRARRSALPNFAKRNGRMICHSCLCIVPEDPSMPFACNCKERQRQRAARLRCGGYPTNVKKERRSTVVANANGHLTNNRGTAGEEKPLARRKASDVASSTTPKVVKRKSSDGPAPGSGALKSAKIADMEPPHQVPSTSTTDTNELPTPADAAVNKSGGLSKFPEYVVRQNHNSPLQITLLKVTAKDASATMSNGETPRRMNGHHHRRHHHNHKTDGESRTNCHTHHRKHRCQNDVGGDDDDEEEDDSLLPVIKRNSDIGCDPRLRVVNYHNAKVVQCNEKAIKQKERDVEVEKNDLPNGVTNSRQADGSSKSMTPDESAAANSVQDQRRISLEAKITMIKERILGTPPKATTNDVNSNATHQQSSRHASINDTASVSSTVTGSTSWTAVMPYTCTSPLAADLPESVKSTVSALIRAEIYRHETTRGSTVQQPAFLHGILRGALVWARAPPSAFWPGLVIGVSESSVRVAWCGEHTYNEVEIPLVSDFLGALSSRFAPNAKESRINKKLCNAVAEALALARPPLDRLDRRLNVHVTKLLTEKYGWELGALRVYCRGKLISAANQPSIASASSSSSMITVADHQPPQRSTTPMRPASYSAAYSPLPIVTSTTTNTSVVAGTAAPTAMITTAN